MGAVIPFIPSIAGAIGGIFGGKKAQASAMKRSPEEQTALSGAQGAGSALAGQGTSLFNTGTNIIGQGTGMVQQGQSTLAQPTSYYSRLLSGNRALQSQAVAAPRAALSDTYRGAERNLAQSGVQGAARDVARAELGRSRAGAISSLITGVQPGAAAALTSIGENQTGQGIGLTGMGAGIAGQGVGATGASGNLFQGLLGQGFQNRVYGRQEGQNFGQNFGSLIFDLLSGVLKGKGGKGGSLGSSSMAGIFPSLHE